MRRFAPLVPRRTALVRLVLGTALAVGLAISTIQAQIPGRNINMVSGSTWPDGDPFRQRQNEPSIASSTRNPLHLLAGANDYRTVDLPGLGNDEVGDAWLGLFKSFDGGQRWNSTLLPGYPQDISADGLASPIHGYGAGADPVVRAGTNGLIYYAGLTSSRRPTLFATVAAPAHARPQSWSSLAASRYDVSAAAALPAARFSCPLTYSRAASRLAAVKVSLAAGTTVSPNAARTLPASAPTVASTSALLAASSSRV